MRQSLAMQQVATQTTFVTNTEQLIALLQSASGGSDLTLATLTRYARLLTRTG